MNQILDGLPQNNLGPGLFALGLVIASVLAYFFDRSRRMTDKHRHFLGGVIAALLIFALQALPNLLLGKPSRDELALYFSAYFAISLILLHHLAYIFGGEITRRRRGSKGWVKAIDYVYLLFGFIGIIKVINADTGYSSDTIDRWAPWLLGFAIAFRLTKTSIEIWGWDNTADTV